MRWKDMDDEARDRLVAEFVMGWHEQTCTNDWSDILEVVGGWRCPCGFAGDWAETNSFNHHKAPPPHYSTDMSAAWQIVQYFAALSNEPFEERWKKQHFLHELGILPCNYPGTFDNVMLEVLATWTPERICKAALVTVGFQKDEEE